MHKKKFKFDMKKDDVFWDDDEDFGLPELDYESLDDLGTCKSPKNNKLDISVSESPSKLNDFNPTGTITINRKNVFIKKSVYPIDEYRKTPSEESEPSLSIISGNTKAIVSNSELIIESTASGARKPQATKKSLFLASLRYILPKSCREEAMCDIYEMNIDLKAQGFSKIQVILINLLHFTSIVLHGIFFKLKDYFFR